MIAASPPVRTSTATGSRIVKVLPATWNPYEGSFKTLVMELTILTPELSPVPKIQPVKASRQPPALTFAGRWPRIRQTRPIRQHGFHQGTEAFAYTVSSGTYSKGPSKQPNLAGQQYKRANITSSCRSGYTPTSSARRYVTPGSHLFRDLFAPPETPLQSLGTGEGNFGRD